MAKDSKDLKELVLFCSAALVLLILVGVGGFVLQSKPSPAAAANEAAPFGPNAEIDERIKVGQRRSGAGGTFSTPVTVLPPSWSNRSPWKGRYPEGVLVEAEELAKPEFAKRFIILDVCPHSQYETRHIQGAIWVSYNTWKGAFTNNRNLQEWEERIGALGIDVDSPVVVYDNGSAQESAYIRSVLLYWGLKDVRLLDGGWPAWLYQGAHQTSVKPQVTAKSIKLRPNPLDVAEKP